MYAQDEIYTDIQYTAKHLEKGEYEGCVFENCHFANTDISDCIFVDCRFIQCDLSNTDVYNTTFRDVEFEGCKMLGMHFEKSNKYIFSANFRNCNLNLCSFYQRVLKQTVFLNCSIKEADFTEADLTAASFNQCDLGGAIFDRTILEKADLSGAINYQIDPETNRIKKAKFSVHGLPGLLAKYGVEIKG
ncbi:MAG: pentapeptide repeat-containing protein [Bacteroidia bacterium]|nr:pentapeptide repeat-containing protein [Bacteroidia bacterium]